MTDPTCSLLATIGVLANPHRKLLVHHCDWPSGWSKPFDIDASQYAPVEWGAATGADANASPWRDAV
jgi:hypothetical protein